MVIRLWLCDKQDSFSSDFFIYCKDVKTLTDKILNIVTLCRWDKSQAIPMLSSELCDDILIDEFEGDHFACVDICIDFDKKDIDVKQYIL